MLSDAARKKIDREVAKYPPEQKQSAVMAALAIVQDEHGWLSPENMADVAGYLGMAPVAVEEVATFYNMYELAPGGKIRICVCTNLPCALSGAGEAAAHLKRRLGIGWNETTPDGKFTLKEGECFGACGDAPVVIVNNKKMLVGMTPERIDETLAELGK
jgi:NADH-quinone oxidoreductase subunit E